MMDSLVVIHDRIKTIATDHAQVKGFAFGVESDIAVSGTTNYPFVWYWIEEGSLSRGEVGLKMKLIVMDSLQKRKVNELDVLSDTHRIMLDFIAKLKMGKFTSDIKFESLTLHPFTEPRYDDEVAGWWTDIYIYSPFDWDSCQIP